AKCCISRLFLARSLVPEFVKSAPIGRGLRACRQGNAGPSGPSQRRNEPMKLDSSISAIITGGASGLGAATARRLAKEGVKIGIFDLQEEKGEALAKELGGVFAKVNVTDEASVDAGFEKVRAAIGQERILVNCAGTGNAIKTASKNKETGAPEHFPLDKFNLIIQINLVGTFRCIAK